MKIKKLLLLITALIVTLSPKNSFSQTNFQNLNFESANVSGYSPNANNVPISLGMPGWSAYENSVQFGVQQINYIWYDAVSAGGDLIAINDSNTGFGVFPLHGNFSACLFGSGAFSVSLSQTGKIPAGSMSVQMDIQSPLQDGGYAVYAPFVVTLGGQTIAMYPLQVYSNYTLYGGNISSLAGTVQNLTITELPPASNPPSGIELDDIVFSPNAVPEPSTLVLGVVGIGLMGLLKIRRPR